MPTWSQMFSAMAVLPMLGRAARMINCPGWKPARDVVEVDEPGRETPVTECPPESARSGDLVHRLLDDVLELERLAPDLVLGDAEDLPLGRFEQLLRGELIGITVANDVGGVLDQLAVGRFFLDDLGVVLGVGRVGDARLRSRPAFHRRRLARIDRDECSSSARVTASIPLFLSYRSRIGRIDHLVGIAIEILDPQEGDDVVQDLVVEQDAAQHALLGFDILRRQTIGQGAPSVLAARRRRWDYYPDPERKSPSLVALRNSTAPRICPHARTGAAIEPSLWLTAQRRSTPRPARRRAVLFDCTWFPRSARKEQARFLGARSV